MAEKLMLMLMLLVWMLESESLQVSQQHHWTCLCEWMLRLEGAMRSVTFAWRIDEWQVLHWMWKMTWSWLC